MTPAGAEIKVGLIRLVQAACTTLPADDQRELTDMLADLVAKWTGELWDENRERP